MSRQASIHGAARPPGASAMPPSVTSRPTGPGASHASGRRAADVTLVADEAGLAVLRPAWNGIAAERADLSVFAWHEWFDAAWQWRKDSARLHVLTWSDRGEVKAILPMLVRTVKRPLGSLRELSLLTVPDTQVCDMLVADAHRAQAAQAFASYLVAHAGDWEVMRLAYLRPDSAIATGLAAQMLAVGCRVAHGTAPGNPFVSLDGGWTAYYGGRSRRLKKANNLAANRLAKAGNVRIDWFEPGTLDCERLAALVDGVVDVSKQSWKSQTGTTLDQPGPGAFIRRLSALAATRGWLSIWVLSLDGRTLAMEYQLVHEGNVHALRSDFRSGHEDLSPGSHLSRTMLEQLFGRGLKRYYMGPGNNAYKFRWAEDAEPQTAVTVYSRSFAGRALCAWECRLKPRLSAIKGRIMTPAPPPAGSNDD